MTDQKKETGHKLNNRIRRTAVRTITAFVLSILVASAAMPSATAQAKINGEAKSAEPVSATTQAKIIGEAKLAEPVFATAAITSTAAATTAKAPGEARISSLTSPAYNKVNLKWKKVSGATHYFIYYREEKASKWTRVASVKSVKSGSTHLTYTHTASKKYPIKVGTTYAYTIKAYNVTTRKSGSYDRRGQTIKTVPNKVSVKSAVWNDTRTAVTVSWGKASGGDTYRVYRKTDSSPKWKRIAEVGTAVHQFTDGAPAAGEKNYYTVRTYDSKTKTAGKYNKTGLAAVSRSEAEIQQTARLLKKTATAQKTKQIILVVDHNLSFWEKNAAGEWSRKLTAYCGYGRNGMSDDRHEGDMTTPIGSFPILHGFGKAANPGSTMQYRKITKNSYWSGEYSTYNQWVESPRRIGGEHLIDYYQYKYAMAIGFNRNPTVYKKGAAIFLHCKSYDHWSTAGCVGVEEAVMKDLLKRSHNGVYIVIVRQQSDIAKY